MKWISSALAVSGAAAFRWDEGADIFEATDGLCRLLDLPPETSIRSLGSFLRPIDFPDRQHLERALRASAGGGPDFDDEFSVRRPDGSRTWLRVQGGRPDFDDRDRRVLGVCTDVTARHRVRDDLVLQARSAVESEFRLQVLLEVTPLGIVIMDPEGNPTFYNPKAEEMHGFSFGKDAARRWVEAVHPQDRERVRRNWYEAASRGGPWEDTYRFVHDDGRVIWVSGRAAAIRLDGELIGFVGTLEDITALKSAEADLEESLQREQDARADAERRARGEQALREATAAVSASATTEEVIREIARNAVIATNADGAFVEQIDIASDSVIIIAIAGKAALATGTRAPYSGSLAQQVVEEREAVILPRLSRAQRPIPQDLARLYPDGTAVVVPLDGDEPIGSLILVREDANVQFNDDELRRARTFANLATLAFRKIRLLEDSENRREELERVLQSRARLMRGFSHDVKNPLGAADGFLGLLMEGIPAELTGDQKSYVARARSAIATSLKLIEDLIAIARAETGQIEIKWEPVDVRQAAREVVDQYAAKASAKGLTMEIHVPDHLPVIESDATRVRQVLGNLFSNAVKYTEHGRVDVSVSVRPAANGPGPGEWIAAEVRDTGRGIPPDKQSTLFQEFTRLEPDRKEGSGIGLAISRFVARALGGDITISSEPGAGSVFTFWLPCARGPRA